MTNILRRGLMLVLSSPSGAGKTTISRSLLERDSDLTLSVSHTTREPRPGEVHGEDYFFISQSEFQTMVDQDQFLEHALVFGNYYGTQKKPVEDVLQTGKDVLFDIDWQGTQQLRQSARSDVVSVFVLPPTWKELENRLHRRAKDSIETIRYRMSRASEEIRHWAEYDYILINDDIEDTVKRVHHVLQSERLRRDRQLGLTSFVRNLISDHSSSNQACETK